MNEFLKNTDAKDVEEVNEKLQEFIQKYNNNQIKYETTLLDDAYELLEKANQAKIAKGALKLAKQVFDTSNECFDAILFQVEYEDDPLIREKS